jgi:hypothetical protein
MQELIQKYKAFSTVTNFLEAQNPGSEGGNTGTVGGTVTLNGGSGSGSTINGATGGQTANSDI